MRGSCIRRMRSRCIFFGKEVLIRQDEQDAAPQVAEVGLRHRRLAHNVSQQARDVHVLLLPVVPEDRLEHILRIGGLLGTFAAKMAHRRWRSARVPRSHRDISAHRPAPPCRRRTCRCRQRASAEFPSAIPAPCLSRGSDPPQDAAGTQAARSSAASGSAAHRAFPIFRSNENDSSGFPPVAAVAVRPAGGERILSHEIRRFTRLGHGIV